MKGKTMIECVLKTSLAEAIKKDRDCIQACTGVENGHHVNEWLKEVADDFIKVQRV